MSDLVEIVDTIRRNMGETNFFKLKKAFRVNDTRGDGTFDYTSFEDILSKCGIFLKRQDQTKIYGHFDPNKTETLSASDFALALQGEMSARRLAMVLKAFGETAGDWTKYNPEAHPDVQMGKKNAEQINLENETCFNMMGAGSPMTSEQFVEFYSTKSAGDPYDDNRFIATLSGPWGVAEDGAGNNITAGFLQSIECVLWEKVRQRTCAGAQERETLRLALLKLDLEDSGSLNYEQFVLGLEKFGMPLDAQVSAALFASHAENGVLNAQNFADGVCSHAQ